jgi:hypothetical protein
MGEGWVSGGAEKLADATLETPRGAQADAKGTRQAFLICAAWSE